MRMRVYCKNCDTETNSGTILAINDEGDCELCRAAGTAELVPEYETPEQYEKRTGKKWRGVAWIKYPKEIKKWGAVVFEESHEEDMDDRILFVCAQSSEPPPDDWRPKEGV